VCTIEKRARRTERLGRVGNRYTFGLGQHIARLEADAEERRLLSPRIKRISAPLFAR
jgi:hypothetical protein